MSSADIYRAKADELLREAAATEDMERRSWLIAEAVRWNMMAQQSGALRDAVGRLGDQAADVEANLKKP